MTCHCEEDPRSAEKGLSGLARAAGFREEYLARPRIAGECPARDLAEYGQRGETEPPPPPVPSPPARRRSTGWLPLSSSPAPIFIPSKGRPASRQRESERCDLHHVCGSHPRAAAAAATPAPSPR